MTQANNFFRAFPGHPRSTFYGRALAYLPAATPGFRVPANTVLATSGGEGPKDNVFLVLDPDGDIPDQLGYALAQGYHMVELGVPGTATLGEFMMMLTHIHGVGLGVIAKNAMWSAGPKQYMGHPNVFGCVVERGKGSPLDHDRMRREVRKDGLMPVWFVFDGALGADECADEIRTHDLKGMGVTFGAGLSAAKYDDTHTVLNPTV